MKLLLSTAVITLIAVLSTTFKPAPIVGKDLKIRTDKVTKYPYLASADRCYFVEQVN